MTILGNGYMGIGTTSPQNPLSVNGIIQAKEVLVNTGWSDYVFESGYRLAPLTEVAEKGIGVGEMESKLLAKIEELTLHMIEAEKENRELKERLTRLERRSRQ
jgi:hypothetical protein